MNLMVLVNIFKEKKHLIFVFGFLITFVNGQAKDLHLRDYICNDSRDVTLAVFNILKDASNTDDPKIIIEKGVYHFYPEKAYQKYCFISNHDNSMRRIAFPIIDFEKLEIEGNDAQLIFHGLMMPFLIENSKNVEISGISIDWDISLHSEAVIIANDSINNSFDIKISNQFPYIIRNKKLYFIKEGGLEQEMGGTILFDPEKHTVAYNTLKYTPVDVIYKKEIRFVSSLNSNMEAGFNSSIYSKYNIENQTIAEELSPGVVRLSNIKEVPPVGMVLVISAGMEKGRLANAFHVNKSTNVQFSHINIYHAGGMGIIGERSRDILLDHVNIQVRPGSNRMVSTTADATHFVNCKGKITLQNCTFQHMLDDATNVHGTYVIFDSVLDKNKLAVRVGHPQQAGFTFAETGDKIGFINPTKSTQSVCSSVVKSVESVNDRYYIITFNEDVATLVSEGFVLENLDWYPELTIKNCNISNNRARGILLSTPKPILIKDNYFSNMMSAILIPDELDYWYESGHTMDLRIINNKFGDSGYGGGNYPVIWIQTVHDESDYIFGKILIENNEFNQFDQSIIRAKGVEHLVFSNNRISNSHTYAPLNPNESVFNLEHIKKLELRSNKLSEDVKQKAILNNIENKVIEF